MMIGRAVAASSPPRIATRKEPKQSRSADLVATILEAAVRVLSEDGAARFTTARVAERAGVSVGSLYQYFPNKASILFRLQSDEWRRNHELLSAILEDQDTPPENRLRELVRAFVKSECDEAAVRNALSDAAPLYRDAPEAIEVRGKTNPMLRTFMREALPDTPEDERRRVGDLIMSTLTSVAKRFSETPREDDDIQVQADAMADMFIAYLRLARSRATG